MGEGNDDSADAARGLAGDQVAFEGIVRRWQGRLLNLAWRFCRDRATAEDMAQEAFARAFRRLSTFRGDSSFGTWLTAVALNTYRTRLRALGPPLLGLDPSRVPGLGEPGPDRALEERDRAEAVRRAVLALPRRYRDAIVVYYFQERDLSEAARVLNIAEGTLKGQLHRGRELLRRRCAHLDAGAGQGIEEGV
jgi:RNA polymerase sigma-70 factor (ECF subfamily)